MDTSCFLTAVATGGAVSIVAAAVLILLGGYGGYMRLSRAVNTAYDEMERIEGRIEREVKTRAALSPSKRDPLVDSLAAGAKVDTSMVSGSRRADILRRSRANAL